MSNYRFNEELLKALPGVTGLFITQICQMCHLPTATYREWKDKGKIPLAMLIRLCNGLKIPIMHFVVPEGDVVIGEASEYINWGSKFHPIRFDLEKLRMDITENIGMNYSQIGRILNVTRPSAKKWLNEKKDGTTMMTADQFLLVCNKFKLYPGNYLNDDNMKLVQLPLFRKDCKKVDMSDFVKNHSKRVAQIQRIITEIVQRQQYGIPIDEGEVINMASEECLRAEEELRKRNIIDRPSQECEGSAEGFTIRPLTVDDCEGSELPLS